MIGKVWIFFFRWGIQVYRVESRVYGWGFTVTAEGLGLKLRGVGCRVLRLGV